VFPSAVSRATPLLCKPDGSNFEIIQSDAGLRHLDTADHGVAIVTKVAQNKTKYTNTDYLEAVTARNLQIKIGRPSTRDYALSPRIFFRIVRSTRFILLQPKISSGLTLGLSKAKLHEERLTGFAQFSYPSFSNNNRDHSN
jgi:hypothetical protein